MKLCAKTHLFRCNWCLRQWCDWHGGIQPIELVVDDIGHGSDPVVVPVAVSEVLELVRGVQNCKNPVSHTDACRDKLDKGDLLIAMQYVSDISVAS